MRKIQKVLIANRGEIAVRVIKTLRKLGISSVAVYAKDDAHGLHTSMADEKVLLEGNTLSETYLNIDQLVKIALRCNVDAVHPGYGFLSENPEFAKACELNKIVFIGPAPEAIRLMGNKVEARGFVKSINIPIIEGMKVEASEIMALKDDLNFPLIIKAAAGGGGKGMRIVRTRESLATELEESQREIKNYFGNSEIYLEKYIENPRHIEVQILSDKHGNHIHLFERECSLQRRYQKIIEEAPAVSLDANTRKKLHEVALKIASSMNYESAGTIEFLVDNSKNIYFLEMNTRIQVEHPVTEEITGIDIVESQIQIAEGKPLPFKQQDIQVNGHALEARIYAEDPLNGFIPAPGLIDYLNFPQHSGIRIDKGHKNVFEVSAKYDPMIAKIISTGQTRKEAVERLSKALKETVIHGIKNNLAYLNHLLTLDNFKRNRVSTQYLEFHHHEVLAQMNRQIQKTEVGPVLLAGFIWDYVTSVRSKDPFYASGSWRLFQQIVFQLNGSSETLKVRRLNDRRIFLFPSVVYEYQVSGNRVTLKKDADSFTFHVSEKKNGSWSITTEGFTFELKRENVLHETNDESTFLDSRKRSNGSNGFVVSPLNGTAIKINVQNGQKVNKGEILLVIESMKMENKIVSTENGVVEGLKIETGQQVRGNEILMYIKQEIESNEFK